ncbi:hypothetical protein [Galactobacter caseinivorans]|uniref:hypothetical protein n=1 Tax=Galactobacter caseinivorans TaxID=2676123 RepID=UPI0011C3EFAD|nr:hypothetical protein [Galactobacter caseinivorans]
MKKSKRSLSVPLQTREAIAHQVTGADGKPKQGVQNAMLKVLGIQRPLVLAYLRRLRKRHPNASVVDLARMAERDYLRTVTGTGAGGGVAAVVPGVGTVASFGVSAGVAVAFLESSALYAQTIAELHGIAVEDPEQARNLVMAVLLGDEAAGMMAGVSDQLVSGPKGMAGWGAAFGVATGKGGAWSSIGKELQTRFLRHFAASQAAGAMGRALPFGIGAAVGGISNRVLGRRVVQSTMSAFAGLRSLNAGELDAAVAGASPHLESLARKEREKDLLQLESARGGTAAGASAAAGSPTDASARGEVDAAVEAELRRRRELGA